MPMSERNITVRGQRTWPWCIEERLRGGELPHCCHYFEDEGEARAAFRTLQLGKAGSILWLSCDGRYVAEITAAIRFWGHPLVAPPAAKFQHLTEMEGNMKIQKMTGDIIASLNAANEELTAKHRHNTPWTTGIKSALCRLGKRHDFYVCAKGVSRKLCNNGEWMFDVAWIDYKNGDPDFPRRLVLAAECEWGKTWGDVRDDWLKLLVARADFRLMVFERSNERKVREEVNRLKKQEAGFQGRQVGDRYLLAGRDESAGRFLFFTLDKKTGIREV